MDRNVPKSNSAVAISDSPRSWPAPTNHGVSVTTQSPRPKIPIPLLGMNDSEIANGYDSFLRQGSFLRPGPKTPSLGPFQRATSSDIKDPSLNLITPPPSLTPIPNPLRGTEDLEFVAHHPDFVRPASLLYNNLPYDWIFEAVDDHGRRLCFVGPTDWLYIPRDTSLDFICRSSSPHLPDFKPTLYWQQPLNILFCGVRSGDGIGHTLTAVDFDDPTKPHPVLHHESAAMISSSHSFNQCLISCNDASADERAKIAGYDAHSFGQCEQQLDEVAGDLKAKIRRGESIDALEEDILNMGIMLPEGQKRQISDILQKFVKVDAAIKTEYELDESSRGNQRPDGLNLLAIGLRMGRRMPSAKHNLAEKGLGWFAETEPLEPLFGLNPEDKSLEPSSEYAPMALMFGLDAEDDGFVFLTENEGWLERPFALNTEDDQMRTLMDMQSLEALMNNDDEGCASVTANEKLEKTLD